MLLTDGYLCECYALVATTGTEERRYLAPSATRVAESLLIHPAAHRCDTARHETGDDACWDSGCGDEKERKEKEKKHAKIHGSNTF